ncbi:hypothetical protein BD779DRAFT_1676741 [Infundibulicybe gibba]|nr:hypothetical protein BD779DRAFT_1676741 [Infundibulicybe gibba]
MSQDSSATQSWMIPLTLPCAGGPEGTQLGSGVLEGSNPSDDVTLGKIVIPGLSDLIRLGGELGQMVAPSVIGYAWPTLGQQGREAAATIGQTVVSVVADLNDLNRRDVSNTLEFASRYANALVPKGEESASWSWFHDFTSAIPTSDGLRTRMGTFNGSSEMPAGTNTIAELVVGIANTGSTFDPIQRQLVQRTMNAMTLAASTGTMGLFGQFEASKRDKSFTVTAASAKDGVLTMRTIGLEFQSTGGSMRSNGQFGGIVQKGGVLFYKYWEAWTNSTKEIVDFTANQPFLDAHREDIEQRLQKSAGEYVEEVPI